MLCFIVKKDDFYITRLILFTVTYEEEVLCEEGEGEVFADAARACAVVLGGGIGTDGLARKDSTAFYGDTYQHSLS